MKNAVIIGWGKSGKGAAKLLLNHGIGVSVYADAELDLSSYPQVDNVSKLDYFDVISGKDTLVLSPSVPMDHPLVEYARRFNLSVIGEIELGYKFCKGNIIAITGTNGKTTTTKLIGDIINAGGIKAYTLGNIGESFCESVDAIGEREIAVLEVSSFQLQSVKDFHPHIASCLNVTPDHMERHKTMDNYAMSKFNIFINQGADDYAILNYDDAVTRGFVDMISADVYFTSNSSKVRGAFVRDGKIIVDLGKEEELISLDEIPLKGKFNYQNVMTAALSCILLGVDKDVIAEAIRNFKPPKYRNEYIGDIDGKNIFNDSKATNIDSTLKACESMRGDTALIVGGYDKGIAYDGFFSGLPSCVKHIIATGDNVYSIMQFLPSYHEYTFEITSSLQRAAELALEKDVRNILFSPTTSSFDRYSGYMERGEHFDMIIGSLKDGGKL